jgi:acyl carrier protein
MTPEEEIILQIIADIVDVDLAVMSPEKTMHELGTDELHMVEITMALEQAIDVVFPDNRLLINPERHPGFCVQDILNIAAEYY